MAALMRGGKVPFSNPFLISDADRVLRLLRSRGRRQTALWAEADEIRRAAVGDTVHLRALLEFSSRCLQDCRYCGLRRSRAGLERFSLTPDEIVTWAVAAAQGGYRTVVLQSGEDPFYGREVISDVIRRVKGMAPDVAVTLSVGDRTPDDYRAWRKAGADRYLLKHETADPQLYATLRPGHRLADRLARARYLSDLGYAVGLGNMIGLPGQTPMALVADLRLLAAFRPAMVAIGPFVPHPETPLARCPAGDPDLSLNFLALTRLVLPEAMIPATTSLAAIKPEWQVAALRAGANVIMVDVGRAETRALYDIYPNRTTRLGDQPPGPGRPSRTRDQSTPRAGRRRILDWLQSQGWTGDGVAVDSENEEQGGL